jgi:hypothetical protein
VHEFCPVHIKRRGTGQNSLLPAPEEHPDSYLNQ